MAIDLLNGGMRSAILADIKSEDNKARKREQQKRFDVYRDRQDRYILEKLCDEFGVESVKKMRKVLSINLSKRMVDEMSGIYNGEPGRTYTDASDNEMAQLDELYNQAQVDPNMRMANKYYNLHDQTALMVVPMGGKVCVRPLAPHQYDVIPSDENPEEAAAYIMNVWDKDMNSSYSSSGSLQNNLQPYRSNDTINQSIADDNDREAAQERYVVWTPEVHFTMDGNGLVVSEVQQNPIGRLPFIDIATEKDFQFFVRRGSSIVDFAIDFGLMLSDLANISRMQGYSQAIIFADKAPTSLNLGPSRILFIPIDPNQPDINPRFEFASPSADLTGALELLETQLRLFLASRGIDPGTISGKGEAKSFSSGIERLLSMLDKFEASKSDFDLFRNVEMDMFELMRDWSNVLQGTDLLMPELQQARLNDMIEMDVRFHEPGIVRTQTEREDAAIKLLEQGLMSRKEALMDIRGISDDKAMEIMAEIDGEGLGDRETEVRQEEDEPNN